MSLFNARSSRREFLIQTSAISAAAVLPMSLSAQTDASPNTQIDLDKIQKATAQIPSRDTQLKFNPDGTRRAFAGNTVICHLPVQCAMRDAMVALHDEFASASFHHKLGLTSLDSYHMTIFPGANDQDRTVTGWPSYVPPDAPIEECNRMVGEKMAKAHLAGQLPLRVRLDEPHTLNYPIACSLRMIPVDDAENTKLRSIRDQLAEIYGFRLKDHAQYEFHITMSYQLSSFTDREQTAYWNLLQTHIKRIAAAEPVLELGVPEYCTFPDMFRFEPQKLIACS